MNNQQPLILTSMAPRLKRGAFSADTGDYQMMTIASWLRAGLSVTSINYPHEIDELQGRFPDVRFEPARIDLRSSLGRPLVALEDVQRVASESGSDIFLVTNSDILISAEAGAIKAICAAAADSLVYANRSEVDWPFAQVGNTYNYGFDFFGGPVSALARLNLGGFALGAPWWDYWMPVAFSLAGVPLVACEPGLFNHVSHEQRWSYELWASQFMNVLDKLKSALAQANALALPPGIDATGLQSLAQGGRMFEEMIGFFRNQFRSAETGGGARTEAWIGHFGTALGVFFCSYLRSRTTGKIRSYRPRTAPRFAPAADAAIA